MNDVIPDGWSNPKLDDIVTKFQNGYAFSAKGYVPEGIPIISMGSIQLDGTFKKNNTKLKYWDAAAKEDLSRYLVKSEDLIMAMTDVTPTMELIGRACIVKGNGEYFLNQRVGLISVDEEKSSKPFLSYLTNFNQWRSYCIGSSGLGAQANLGTSQILDGSILLPPLPEQQKIAAILSSVDEVIEKTQAQINKLKDLKTGMMQELLSPREGQATNINNPQGESKNSLHHTEFKDSPLGRIPVGWEVAKFKDVFVDYKYGPRFSSKDYSPNGNVKTIRGTDVSNNGEVHYQQVPTAQIDADTVEAHKLKDGDLVMITTADCGASAVFREQNIPYIASAYAIKLTPTNKVIPAYIKFFMQTSNAMTQIESFIRKGTVANLPGSDVMNIELALPPIKSQEKISSILNALEDKIELVIKKNIQLKRTKKALMQDLLTGKVRVKVDAA